MVPERMSRDFQRIHSESSKDSFRKFPEIHPEWTSSKWQQIYKGRKIQLILFKSKSKLGTFLKTLQSIPQQKIIKVTRENCLHGPRSPKLKRKIGAMK